MISREDLERWILLDNPMLREARASETDPVAVLDLLWPIVDAFQKRTLVQGRGLFADEIELLNELEGKLGKKKMGL